LGGGWGGWGGLCKKRETRLKKTGKRKRGEERESGFATTRNVGGQNGPETRGKSNSTLSGEHKRPNPKKKKKKNTKNKKIGTIKKGKANTSRKRGGLGLLDWG